jgi:N-dimethylarginine dimethylaminohydrolase
MTRSASTAAQRSSTRRTYLMCPPEYFRVEYAINPWMHPGQPSDPDLAMRQWQRLRDTYSRLGHVVRTIDPLPALPDMVFAANGATVIDGKVLGARFRYAQRAAEGPAYLAWFISDGYRMAVSPHAVNEGEGDIVFGGRVIFVGHGFRTDPAAAEEVEKLFGRPVVKLHLVDARFYHLDTALCVLDADTAAYYPPAFDDASRAALAGHFRDLIEVKDEDAEVLGVNAVSDGRHVVLPEQASGLAAQFASKGFEPVRVDMSEFLKAGGGPKCCTLELR